jgi:hypothetical protein
MDNGAIGTSAQGQFPKDVEGVSGPAALAPVQLATPWTIAPAVVRFERSAGIATMSSH